MDLRQTQKKAKENGFIHHYQVQKENCQTFSGIFKKTLQDTYGNDGGHS
jgi:hypothetical protein